LGFSNERDVVAVERSPVACAWPQVPFGTAETPTATTLAAMAGGHYKNYWPKRMENPLGALQNLKPFSMLAVTVCVDVLGRSRYAPPLFLVFSPVLLSQASSLCLLV